ncbi:MAG: hypothetical protein ACK5RV_00650 [Flavobacterium sp.]|jgi:hypothetical protein|uniref:hypothetical protein n=1 Tax=Flavobacterium sp. TaxID=239 RepID=UPI0022C04ED4|nr:hypothetical protein [Flavobacterium sp.]MCZ8167819.1 hypothetical protein [Flavobacterium sp.]
MKKIILGLLFFGGIVYLTLPVLNYGFYPIAIIVFLLLGMIYLFSMKISTDKEFKKFTVGQPPHKAWKWVVLVLFLYLTIIPLVTTATFLNTDRYQKLIGTVKKGNSISQQMAPIGMDQIRVVDRNLAYLLGEKIIGSQPALGSQVQLGQFSIQKVHNELYWVAPLLHSGFFKWMNNTQGTPGYVMVSATNERDVRLVQQVGSQPVQLKFQPGAFFQSNLHRHLYFNGYATTGLEDFVFEIDESGRPYWVVSTYEKTIGFSGKNTTGVVVVDAQTGDLKSYTLATTPAWVDRIQPATIVETQLEDWGEYINGYWNFSNKDKLQITEGLTLVYGKNNRSYWYTGITSVGSDESAVGFVLVDTRTKETTFYKQSGATEYAAQQSAEGKVQEKGYKAALPIPYNINGIPTYIMTLKDDGGLVKMYAMVAINDYTIVGVGNSMRETLTAFKSAYNSSGSKLASGDSRGKKQLESVVTRIQTDVKNGSSVYYFTVKGMDRIFVGSSQISAELPITTVGDSISIAYDVDGETIIDVTRFDNKAFR